MYVELIAQTSIDGMGIYKRMDLDPHSSESEDLIEFAGRTCYQSYDKPNAKTRSNSNYIANIIKQRHESVLEHASASFYVEGVSRNLLLELERHRHLSFSVISQRFVNSQDTPFINPPAFISTSTETTDVWENAVVHTQFAYEKAVSDLLNKGLPRKAAREAARAILPGGIETKFVVTGNLRAWRDVLRKRYSVHADAEIRNFAKKVLHLLYTNAAPSVFADFPSEPFND